MNGLDAAVECAVRENNPCELGAEKDPDDGTIWQGCIAHGSSFTMDDVLCDHIVTALDVFTAAVKPS